MEISKEVLKKNCTVRKKMKIQHIFKSQVEYWNSAGTQNATIKTKITLNKKEMNTKITIMKIVITCILLWCLSSTVKAQINFNDYFNNPQWHESHSEMEKAQSLTFTQKEHKVQYIHDVDYMTSHGENLTLQILKPENWNGEKYPCIVYVQGSAWMKQNVYANLPALGEFAKRGYVIAVVEYVHSGIAPFPVQLQNTKTAIRFMRKEAEKYNVDTDNVFIWGDSSGGHLALMTAVTEDISEFDTELYKEYSTNINACVSYYGVTDIKSIHTDPCSASSGKADSPEGMLLGGINVSKHIKEADIASPVNYVNETRDIPPILLAVGTCDHIVPFSQTELMARKLEEAGKEYVYYVLEGADHGTWEFWTGQTFNCVDEFLKKYIK